MPRNITAGVGGIIAVGMIEDGMVLDQIGGGTITITITAARSPAGWRQG
jgi:hypothetical protein